MAAATVQSDVSLQKQGLYTPYEIVFSLKNDSVQGLNDNVDLGQGDSDVTTKSYY